MMARRFRRIICQQSIQWRRAIWRSTIGRRNSKNTGNLGGTIRTLDGKPEARLMSGKAYYRAMAGILLDDSKSVLQTGNWVSARPQNGGQRLVFVRLRTRLSRRAQVADSRWRRCAACRVAT